MGRPQQWKAFTHKRSHMISNRSLICEVFAIHCCKVIPKKNKRPLLFRKSVFTVESIHEIRGDSFRILLIPFRILPIPGWTGWTTILRFRRLEMNPRFLENLSRWLGRWNCKGGFLVQKVLGNRNLFVMNYNRLKKASKKLHARKN